MDSNNSMLADALILEMDIHEELKVICHKIQKLFLCGGYSGPLKLRIHVKTGFEVFKGNKNSSQKGSYTKIILHSSWRICIKMSCFLGINSIFKKSKSGC